MADGKFSHTELRIHNVFLRPACKVNIQKTFKNCWDLQRVNSTTAGRYGMHVRLRRHPVTKTALAISIPCPGTALDGQSIENSNRDRIIIECFHDKPTMVR